MFQSNALSLDMAPPIKSVLRFFITATIFGMVAGVFITLFSNKILDFSSIEALILTHTLTLGILASFMLGALFQMLPVLCGVSIKAPIDTSLRINYFLIFGTIFLLIGFYNSSAINYFLAAFFLTLSLIGATFIMLIKLFKIKHSSSSKGITISLISLFFLVVLGLLMLYVRSGNDLSLNYLDIKTLHLSYGLFGWITLLIISVSFQVIEMFYVTKPYNKKYANYVTIIIFALITLSFFLSFLIYVAILIQAIHFALTIYKLKNKKRPINDVSVWFWYFGSANFLIFSIFALSINFFNINIYFLAIFFSYFALSIIFGMAYKIVPFLSWFHLNSQGYINAPMMHEFISAKFAKYNLYIFLISFIFALLSYFLDYAFTIFGILFFISFLLLFISIYNSLEKYNFTLKNGKKFTFPSNL